MVMEKHSLVGEKYTAIECTHEIEKDNAIQQILNPEVKNEVIENEGDEVIS